MNINQFCLLLNFLLFLLLWSLFWFFLCFLLHALYLLLLFLLFSGLFFLFAFLAWFLGNGLHWLYFFLLFGLRSTGFFSFLFFLLRWGIFLRCWCLLFWLTSFSILDFRWSGSLLGLWFYRFCWFLLILFGVIIGIFVVVWSVGSFLLGLLIFAFIFFRSSFRLLVALGWEGDPDAEG